MLVVLAEGLVEIVVAKVTEVVLVLYQYQNELITVKDKNMKKIK
jgi:hypothetical protein